LEFQRLLVAAPKKWSGAIWSPFWDDDSYGYRPADDPTVGVPSSERQNPGRSGTDVQSCIQGWINYYSDFYKSALYWTLSRIDAFLIRWARIKFKRLRQRPRGAREWLARSSALIPLSSPIGVSGMSTAEHREPYEPRGSRTVLGAPGGATPPGRLANQRFGYFLIKNLYLELNHGRLWSEGTNVSSFIVSWCPGN
jgi:hypothetical protein